MKKIFKNWQLVVSQKISLGRSEVRGQRSEVSNKGFSIVEIVVAVLIAIVFFLSIYGVLLFSNKTMAVGLRKMEATHFAQEGIEIARTMRNSSWTDNIAPVGSGVAHYALLSGDQWTLALAPPPLINGIFTRTIALYDVNRDVNDDISNVGINDPKTKRVVVNVVWQERGISRSIPLEIYITDFLSN